MSGTTHADPERAPEEQDEVERLGKEYRELEQFRQRQTAQDLRRAVFSEAFLNQLAARGEIVQAGHVMLSRS